ncbi:MAG: hypothetical protein QNJ44_02430 [Rhodobacter sp.]|nr:hypothetical protein [Rhodobacter sp.]
MTALTEYQRLETPGVWRASPDDQRRDVIVSVGDATLVIYDMADRALAHWSLPAVERLNQGNRPALYSPGMDSPEELELADDMMVDAIETVRRAIAKRRPQPGRLRFFLLGGGLAAVIALGIFWLPDALVTHTTAVVPDAKRTELGTRLLANIRRIAGAPCTTPRGNRALDRLYSRLLGDRPGEIIVLPGGIAETAHLPGGLILMNRTLVEDHEDPNAAAGFVLAEALRAETRDPVGSLLRATGPVTAFRLLTTGDIPKADLASYAESLLAAAPADVPPEVLLSRFAEARVPATPYAYARDISGESTLPLIEADPIPPGGGQTVLPDGDWVSLQGICGE